jgi:hypothetical protein
MATRFVFGPAENEVRWSDVPVIDAVQGRPVASAPDVVGTEWGWTAIAPQDLTLPATLVVHGIATGTGNLKLRALVEAVTPGDALNLIVGSGYAAVNESVVTVPATAGYLFTVTISLTNDDGMEPGDLLRIQLTRFPTDSLDTLAGTFYPLALEFRDSA